MREVLAHGQDGVGAEWIEKLLHVWHVGRGQMAMSVEIRTVSRLASGGGSHELHDSIEQPARWRAQSGRLAAYASRPVCSV